MKQWWEQIRSFGKQRKKEQLLTAVLVVVILLLVFLAVCSGSRKTGKTADRRSTDAGTGRRNECR